MHDRLRPSLLEALEDVRQHHKGAFCHPRAPPGNTGAGPGARPDPGPSPEPGQELDFHANIPFLQPPDSAEGPLTLDHDTAFSDISDILSLPVISSSNNWIALTLSHPHPPKTFHIPPKSSFLLSNFQSSTTTFTTLAEHLGRFHFVLLDPPWPNRSAARSRAYSTLSRFDTKDLLRLPVGNALIQPSDGLDEGGGLVGVWITNKPKFRKYVLETLFPRWGVALAGEWVWLKTTTAGELVFDLESSTRKPYEVLLFGRKTAVRRWREGERAGEDSGSVVAVSVPGKIILAVPDLHSRKPCVKGYTPFFSRMVYTYLTEAELIEPYLPPSYRGCEIFGRNLTEGWLTWGDEALKFNWEGHWKKKEDVEVELKEGDVGSRTKDGLGL